MRVRYTDVTTTQKLPYRCKRCGHTTTAIATGQTRMHGHDLSSDAVEQGARSHLRRLTNLARCPKCHRRAPGALLEAIVKSALVGALAGGAPYFVFWLRDNHVRGFLRTLCVGAAIGVFVAILFSQLMAAKNGVEFEGASVRGPRAGDPPPR